MMNVFEVIKPGPFTTVQDGGRFGGTHLGLTEGGPMDYRSFALANRLVDNEPNSAALEISFGGVTLKCIASTFIALTGGFSPLTINNQPKALWQTHALNSGDELAIGFAGVGVRSYLAICGGFKSETWFGSQATVVREGLGEPLKTGDFLLGRSCSKQPQQKLNYLHQPSLRRKAELEFVPGYQWHVLPETERTRFQTSKFEVSKQNNRMGYRLSGAAIHTDIEALRSEGITCGAIQITRNGEPIVLMRDHQTIGGYPKLGTLTAASIDTLSQLTQGASVTFKAITPEMAVHRYRQYHQEIEHLKFEKL